MPDTMHHFKLSSHMPGTLFVCLTPRLSGLISPMKPLRRLFLTLLLLMPCLHSLALDDSGEIPNPVIPALAIDKATLTDAIRFTLAEARKTDPHVSTLNLIVEEVPASLNRVTLDLKNVPLLAALHMMAETCFYTLVIKNNTIELRSKIHGAGERLSVVVDLTPETLRHLGIEKLDEDSARKAFQRLKIDLQKIDKIIPMADGVTLLVQGEESEMEQASSIMALLNRGLRIAP